MIALTGINTMAALYTSQYKVYQPKKNEVKTPPRKVESVLKCNGGGQHFDARA